MMWMWGWGWHTDISMVPVNCGRQADTYVYASLDDLWNALGHATGVLEETSCIRPLVVTRAWGPLGLTMMEV